MTHLDLFTGILGFSLAAQWVWGEEYELVACCEIDPFCQKVIRKHFSEVPIIEDIKKVKWVVADSAVKNDGRYFGEQETRQIQELGDGFKQRVIIPPIDLLTGGFPCQPFSVAGKRGGTEDDRWLWPEMLRTIYEVNPHWIVAENVSGLLNLQDGMVFEGVCTDLEAEGYGVQPLVIPACSVGAPHRRDRVWIIGHSNRIGCFRNQGPERRIQDENTYTNGSDCYAPDSNQFNGNDAGHDPGEISQFKKAKVSRCDSTNPDKQGSQEREMFRRNLRKKFEAPIGNPWQEHWYEAASRLCRVDDGVSRRVDRLRALGNSVVPQVVAEIFRAIKEVEEHKED
jgi:DNA (cytosine-5)-methyltransferase 1